MGARLRERVSRSAPRKPFARLAFSQSSPLCSLRSFAADPILKFCTFRFAPIADKWRLLQEVWRLLLLRGPREFAACLRLMAAAKLYEVGDLSQERAAELAGQSRQDFLANLSRLGVSPFQGVEEDLVSIALLP